MKAKKIKDERVIQLNNKIQSEAYFVVLFLLAISVFIKSEVMDIPFSQYALELGIIVLSIAYIGIRSMLLGFNFINSSKSAKLLTISAIIILSLAISIINGIKNYSLYNYKYTGLSDPHFIAVLVITFVSSSVFILIIFALLYWLNSKGQQKIEKILKEDEEDD